MSSEYQALRAKVDAFTQATATRRHADMACRAGCDMCCHAWLTVSPVEARELREGIARLSPERRQEVAARGRRELAREARGESEPRCAMLDDSGECAVYEQRPLVCRTQGHALRYPNGLVPAEAVRARAVLRSRAPGPVPSEERKNTGAEHKGGTSGEITYCPLNYTAQPPEAADVLDAERVDQLLAVVNHRFAIVQEIPGETRTAISELALEADMLGCP